MPPAISITLYDEEDKPIETYERAIIPWGVLKKATRLMDLIGDADESKPAAPKKRWFFQPAEAQKMRTEEKQLEAISQFVVELFGNRFTVKQLESGADVGEIMTAFQSVLARANAVVKSNPTFSQPPKKT